MQVLWYSPTVFVHVSFCIFCQSTIFVCVGVCECFVYAHRNIICFCLSKHGEILHVSKVPIQYTVTVCVYCKSALIHVTLKANLEPQSIIQMLKLIDKSLNTEKLHVYTLL